MGEFSRADARRMWESAASGWAAWEHVLATGFHDATETMMDVAGAQRGMTILDVACGAGSASMQAAQRVGPGGTVVASDISPSMLRNVQENADRLGLTNVETLESAAEDLSDGGRQFDAAICRLGLMLFGDPVMAARSIGNALKPGAKFAPLVFTTPPNNLYLSMPMQILLRHAGLDAPPGGAGLFVLGAPGLLESRLVEGGYEDVTSKIVPLKLTLESAQQALDMMRGAFAAYRVVASQVPEDGQEAAWSDVGDFMKQYETDAGWEAGLEVIIGSGTASR